MTDPRVESAAPLRILPSGSGAILVELPDLADTMALLADLQAEPLHGVLEMVAGARTLSLRFDPQVTSAEALASALALRRLRPPRPPRASGPLRSPPCAMTAKIWPRSPV